MGRTPITLVSKIPPAVEFFVEHPSEGPSMIVAHPTANRVRLEMNSYIPPENENPFLMMAVGLPFITDGPMRALREMYLASLSRIPLMEYDRYPSFNSFNMSIKILVWNVQGVVNKIPMVKEVIRVNTPTMLVLIETHLSGEQAERVCNKIGFTGRLRVEAQGFSGGIWMFWKAEEISVTSFGSHTQHLTVEIKKVGEDPWLFSAVYASRDSNLRRELWRELESVKQRYDGPWLAAGDFNDTICMNERNGVGGSEMQRRCREFANWVENNELIDLGCSGPAHTWFRGNSADTFKSARLDRGLANDKWRVRFEEGSVHNLPKSSSDHCPILISNTGFAPLPTAIKPFRFQAAWLRHDKFHKFVKENWIDSAPIIPIHSLNLSPKKFKNGTKRNSIIFSGKSRSCGLG